MLPGYQKIVSGQIRNMENFFLPWCKVVTSSDSGWKIDEDIVDILQAYYGDEVYYAEIKTHVEHYLNKQRE